MGYSTHKIGINCGYCLLLTFVLSLNPKEKRNPSIHLKHRFLYIPIALLLLLSFVDCAKKGTPSGGARDTIPPVIVRSIPENYSINFSGDEIEIRFNEYIKLKDLEKQLVISPPMQYRPIITPFNVSKTLKIKILDTLKPNTTYSFNFGKSIVDHNEGNEFAYFKYVFSTGSYIDSLKLTGKIRDAKLIAAEIPATVMLYEANESFTDSIIYFEKPRYVTVSQDSTGSFEFTNLKEGNYFLFALKEQNNNYTFQPRTEKIGFVDQVISLPTDSTYTLTLFKEALNYKFIRASQMGQNHLIFGWEGQAESLDIQMLSSGPPAFDSRIFKDEQKDTLHYWFKPAIKTDSLVFKVSNKENIDTVTVRMKELFKDSLKISAVATGIFKLKDTFKLRSNTPIIRLDSTKFTVMTKDSIFLDPTVYLDGQYNLAAVNFPKTEDKTYTIKVLPGAITDFFGTENDALQFTINTRNSADYGTLNLTLANVSRFPIIVQMVDNKFEVRAEKYLKSELETPEVYFDEITPGEYYLRIIYDDNQNGKWDTGNFLDRREPERVIYYPTPIEVRANWSLHETFILK